MLLVGSPLCGSGVGAMGNIYTTPSTDGTNMYVTGLMQVDMANAENVYHGQGTLRRRRGNPAGLVLEGADGCGGRTGREANRGQGRSRGWVGGGGWQAGGVGRGEE